MTLSPWLRAAIVGPCLSVTAFVTIGVAIGWVDPSLGGRFTNWLYGMAMGGIVALLCGGSLLAVDVAFQRAKLRKLPEGPRAWTVSLAMPFAVIGIYQALAPADDFGPGFFAATLLPIVGVALLLRYTFGEP